MARPVERNICFRQRPTIRGLHHAFLLIRCHAPPEWYAEKAAVLQGELDERTEALREAQVDEVQSELDDLSDLARRNNIPPAVLRG
jgi:hypothetical protein